MHLRRYLQMNKQLKVLIDDGNQIILGTGIGKFSLYLYNAMRENGYNVSLVPQGNASLGRLKDRIAYLRKINSAQYACDLSKYDAVLYTNYAMPYKKNNSTLYAAVIPDMVSFLHPDTLPPMYRYYNQIMIRNSINRADLVFTISKSVEKEIVEKFPKVSDRIRTTWLGLYDGIRPLEKYVDYENPKLQDIDDSDFFLFVSTVEKRKNVGLVLDAFIKLKRTCVGAKNYKIVIVGRPGFGYDKFVEIANKSGYTEDIIFAGYTSDADCNRLYNHAKAFIFPTIYEGFGFAQIECMRCHLPIILSDIPTNREISRDYGEFFQLSNPETLVQKMMLFVDGQYESARKNRLADQYIKEFNWNMIAEQYMEYISDAYRN